MTTVGADHLPQPLRKEGSKAVCPNNGQQKTSVVPSSGEEGLGVVAIFILRADTGVCPYGWCLIIFHFSLFSFHSALCAAPPVACLIPSWNFCCSC